MADFALSTTSTAFLLGLVPAIFWLFFWLRTDRDRPEPFGLLGLCFILGALSVFVASTIQHMSAVFFTGEVTQLVVWAGIEEIVKFAVFFIIAFYNPHNDEAIDPAIYMIAVALGFAALENIFYIIQPGIVGNMTTSLLTGSMRFFGATLLHTIASAFVGMVIGMTSRKYRSGAVLIGLAGAITLHATFNFFILKNDTASALQIYGYLWVAAIISHVTLEKLRRIPTTETITT